MFSLSCTAEASPEPREGVYAPSGSLVVLDGAGVFMSTLVSKEHCASGLTFAHLVIEGGAAQVAAC